MLASKLGLIYLREGRFDEAEGAARQALAGDADNAEALNTVAWLLALRDENKARVALEMINRAIAIVGPNASLLDTRAVALIRSGQPERAIDDLKEAQRLNPKNPNPVLHLAWAYQSSGQLEEAKKAFRQAGEPGWKLAQKDPLQRGLLVKLRKDLGLAAN
jgi:Flp pilus assembly protein TadD